MNNEVRKTKKSARLCGLTGSVLLSIGFLGGIWSLMFKLPDPLRPWFVASLILGGAMFLAALPEWE